MGLFSSKKPKVAPLVMKPTTVTTGFGTGTYDPSTGQAGYTLDEGLSQLRDIFYGASEQFLPTAEQEAYAKSVGDYGQTLFRNATSRDLQTQTKDYYQQQQDILRMERDLESARLANAQFSTGRLGYGEGVTGGYLNPQQFALQMAREQQNAQLMLGAEDRTRAIQGQDITRAMGLADSAAALSMQPYTQANTLFGMGANIEGLGGNILNTVNQFAPLQFTWQNAQQQNQQQINNAKASGGGFLGGLFSSALNAGLNYATGGISGAVQGASGGNLLGGLSSLWSGSSPSSGVSSLFNNIGSGWGGSTIGYTPTNTNIGLGGYTAPVNYGGGTLGPSW